MNAVSLRLKRRFSLLLMLVMTFVPLAQAAYACPLMAQFANEQTLDSAASIQCDDMDMALGALCKSHCEAGQQNVNDPYTPLLPMPVAAPFAVFPPPIKLVLLPLASHSPSLVHATSPPISIRNCCFRI